MKTNIVTGLEVGIRSFSGMKTLEHKHNIKYVLPQSKLSF
jgi:hypothetical protein